MTCIWEIYTYRNLQNTGVRQGTATRCGGEKTAQTALNGCAYSKHREGVPEFYGREPSSERRLSVSAAA